MWNEKSMGIRLLEGGPETISRAILCIYLRQTQAEQASGITNESNSVGFSACDASMGTYWGKWVKSGRLLSGTHLEKARGMAYKYRAQLAEIANAKLAAETQKAA